MKAGTGKYVCPHCGSTQTGVTDSRFYSQQRVRRRKCGECGHRWGTVEVDIELGRTIRRITRKLQAAGELHAQIDALLGTLSETVLVSEAEAEDDNG